VSYSLDSAGSAIYGYRRLTGADGERRTAITGVVGCGSTVLLIISSKPSLQRPHPIGTGRSYIMREITVTEPLLKLHCTLGEGKTAQRIKLTAGCVWVRRP
jgi:hypothetical protein